MTVQSINQSIEHLLTSANVSTRNKRFPLDETSCEIYFRCNEADGIAGGSYCGALSEGPNPLNLVKLIPEFVPIWPARLQTAAAAIRSFNKSLSPKNDQSQICKKKIKKANKFGHSKQRLCLVI